MNNLLPDSSNSLFPNNNDVMNNSNNNNNSNLRVPISVLAMKPTSSLNFSGQPNPPQKAPGMLIEVRRHIQNCNELISLLGSTSAMTMNSARYHQQQQQHQESSGDNNHLLSQSQQDSAAAPPASTAASSSSPLHHLEQFIETHYFGFVRWSSGQDDRRLSTWIPISQIFFPDGTSLASLLFQKIISAPSTLSSSSSSSSSYYLRILQELIISPLLTNRRVRAPIPFEVRHRLIMQTPTKHELDFLEERLRKDGEVPTVHFRMKYLDFTMQPWYYSPYDVVFPQFTTQSQRKVLSNNNNNNNNNNIPVEDSASTAPSATGGFLFDCHLCPFTLQPYRFASELKRSLIRRVEDYSHVQKQYQENMENNNSFLLQPPGIEIYRDEARGLTMYELDGAQSEHKFFCRNLLLIARSFLENKLVGHDAALYTFYVVAIDYDQIYSESATTNNSNNSNSNNKHQQDIALEDDDDHDHNFKDIFKSKQQHQKKPRFFAGYFSVEKGDSEHNLACVVVLPCFQSKGLGRFLISMSYAIPTMKYQKELERLMMSSMNQEENIRSNTNNNKNNKLQKNQQQQQKSAVAAKHLDENMNNKPRNIPGTPERPFSDLGERTYHRYWDELVWIWASKLATAMNTVSISDEDAADVDDNADEMAPSDSSSVQILEFDDDDDENVEHGKNHDQALKEDDCRGGSKFISKGAGAKGKSKNKGKGKGTGAGSENKGKASAAMNKGKQNVNNGKNNNAGDTNAGGDDETTTGEKNAISVVKTISEIASEIGIAVDDARETLLRLGLVHFTERKTFKLLLPPSYSKSVAEKVNKIPNLVRDENFH